MQWDLVESSPGDSSKGHARDRQKKTITLTVRISKAVGLAGAVRKGGPATARPSTRAVGCGHPRPTRKGQCPTAVSPQGATLARGQVAGVTT
ncbi:hypothetical protein BHE74_00040647 [Ensete ventricosum]|nr:hypothetical protein BHE74_00040647 [Ensete ventricosum]